MGTTLSPPGVGKMKTQSNSCQSWQKSIGLLNFYDWFIKRRFFLISIKEGISQKEEEYQGMHYLGRAQFEHFISPQPDVRLEEPSAPFRIQNKEQGNSHSQPLSEWEEIIWEP